MKKFTLIELIISILVIGILAAIVISNIYSFKEEAIKAEIVANTSHLQTIFDVYALKNNGEFPTRKNPTLGNPVKIDLEELGFDKIKSKDFKHGYYWIDFQGVVWGSFVDAPTSLVYQEDTISFNSVNKAVAYDVFGYGKKEIDNTFSSNLKRILSSLIATTSVYEDIAREKLLKIYSFEDSGSQKVITKKLPLSELHENYMISAIDKFGLPTAPVGKDYDGYDSMFPISQSFNLKTNANGEATWLGLQVLEDKPAGTAINYSFEHSNDGKNYTPVNGSISNVPKSQYLKVNVEITPFEDKRPTIYKLKVLFKLDDEEAIEVDLEEDLIKSENIKIENGEIVLQDEALKGKTEHVIQFPNNKFVETVENVSTTPKNTDITTSYQSSKDGLNWSKPVLNPKELDQGKYIKINNEIKKNNSSLKSPSISQIVIKTDNDKNPKPDKEPEIEGEPETEPEPEPETEWESILEIGIVEDATNVGDWISVDVVENLPEDTRISYEYYTSSNEEDWTQHQSVESSPNSRFFKVLVKYERVKGTKNSPQLMEMTINYKKTDGSSVSSNKYKGGKPTPIEPPYPDADPETNFTYTISDDTVTITGYKGKSTVVVIPQRIQGKPVVAIGKNSLGNKGFTSVTMPNSIISIGDGSLANNKLTNITIPNEVTYIGQSAFLNNRLTNVEIPNSVISIEGFAFQANQLTSIVIPNSVTKIDFSAFANNKLTSVTLSSSLTTIGNAAFSSNQLTSIAIPSSVKSIGESAFQSNQLTNVTFSNSLNPVTIIGRRAFYSNKIENLTITNAVASLGTESFYNNINLKTVYMPSRMSNVTITNVFSSKPNISYY